MTPVVAMLLKEGLDLIRRQFPDPEEQAKRQAELIDKAQALEDKREDRQVSLDLGQMGINKAEAESSSLLKGGWRPAVGWVCVLGLLYHLVLFPLAAWVAVNVAGWKQPPPIDIELLLGLLFPLLGLGYYRMREKLAGKA